MHLEKEILELGLLIDLEKVGIQNFVSKSDGNVYTCIRRKGVECWVSMY